MIIISPFSKPQIGGGISPKSYPYWEELVKLLPGEVVQIGVPGEFQLVPDFSHRTLAELRELIKRMDFFISVDNFFPHFCHNYGRHGIVLWGPSDPELFGYPENLNLLKDRRWLRPNQYASWQECDYNGDRFVTPDKVMEAINILYPVVVER